MTVPKVNIKEVDLSTRVPSFQGIYAGIVIPSPKGEVGVPRFITSDTDLLKYFTPNDRVEVGYSLAFYSALAYLSKADKLWVVRADNKSKFGGLIIKKDGSTNIQLTSVEIGSIDGVNQGTKIFTLLGDVTAHIKVDDIIKVGGSTGNDGLYTVVSGDLVSGNTDIEVSEVISDGTVDGSINKNSIVTPENYEFGTDDLMLITGVNEGAWADDISVELHIHEGSLDIVKEPDAFMIKVFRKSTGDLLETHICSRNQNAKDGYGSNIYVEDVTASSNYIKVVDNVIEDYDEDIEEQITKLNIDGSLDGEAVTGSNMISALNTLSNKNDVQLTLVMDGGCTITSFQKAIDTLCKDRKDCISILSTPYAEENTSSYITDIVNYRKTTLNLNSSYSSLYTPHVKITDRFNDRDIFIAPDGYAAGAISETAANSEIWYAPAGYKRGVINVIDVNKRFSSGELDILYDNGINPIKFAPGKGIAIFGQKTLSSRPSALDRLNVRLLLITIEPAIAVFLEDFLFEFNDEFTRLLVKSGIESYMDDIKARRGVYAYQTICDETNNTPQNIDNNEMNVWLFIQPTKVAEFIELTVAITRTGFDFNLAQGLLG